MEKLGLKAGDGGGASNWGLGQPKSDEGRLAAPSASEAILMAAGAGLGERREEGREGGPSWEERI